jgi:hypothetical protein
VPILVSPANEEVTHTIKASAASCNLNMSDLRHAA